jgi:hypothetical protein
MLRSANDRMLSLTERSPLLGKKSKSFQKFGNVTLPAYEQKLAESKIDIQNSLNGLQEVNKYNEQLRYLKMIIAVKYAVEKYISSKASAQDILTIVNSRSRNQPTASPPSIEFQKVLAEAKGIQGFERSKKKSRKDTSSEFESYDKDVKYLGKGIFSISASKIDTGINRCDIDIDTRQGILEIFSVYRHGGLHISDILSGQLNYLESWPKENLSKIPEEENFDLKDIENFEPRLIIGRNIENSETMNTWKLYTPSENFRPPKGAIGDFTYINATFTKGSKEYWAILGTPVFHGIVHLWALRFPHLEITQIRIVTETKTEPEKEHYHIVGHIGKKTKR